jgi:hypothetical protein
VDYFGSVPKYQPSLESSESHNPIGQVTWSITIPHFILTSPESIDAGREHENFSPTTDNHTGSQTLWDACISICMTGDSLGDFWTSSILGTTIPHNNNNIGEQAPQTDMAGKVRSVLETYKYDKYSARNLVFILHLTEVCHIISKRYESILDALKRIVDSEVTNPP